MFELGDKIKTIWDYNICLDEFFSDFNKTLNNNLWMKWFKHYSKIIQTYLDNSLNYFKNVRYQNKKKFKQNLKFFFRILKYKKFNHKDIFKKFPELLNCIKQHPHLDLESCLKNMIPYMKEKILLVYQTWLNLYKLQTGEVFRYKKFNHSLDLSYFS